MFASIWWFQEKAEAAVLLNWMEKTPVYIVILNFQTVDVQVSKHLSTDIPVI